MKDHNPPNAIDTIIARYDDLADAEKVVADYILGHSAGAGLLSATQIAQLSGTSNATVSRFCRSIGYESFVQFRYALSTSAATDDSMGTDDSPSNFPFYYSKAKSQELADTAAQLSYELMMAAHDLLVQADAVYVVGWGPSLWLAQDTAAKFRVAGLRSFADLSEGGVLHNASRLTSRDVLFVVSASEEPEILYEACEAARVAGAGIVTVASRPSARLSELSVCLLPAVSRDKIGMGAPGFSTISISLVVEILAGWTSHSLERVRANSACNEPYAD